MEEFDDRSEFSSDNTGKFDEDEFSLDMLDQIKESLSKVDGIAGAYEIHSTDFQIDLDIGTEESVEIIISELDPFDTCDITILNFPSCYLVELVKRIRNIRKENLDADDLSINS